MFFAMILKSSFTFLICVILSLPGDAQSQLHNQELKDIYKADQSDRSTGQIDWAVISKRDSARMARVYELLRTNKVVTGEDHYNAAMVFQHGSDTVASGMAVKLMRKAIELAPTTNKWLLAAAIDRDLMRTNRPQIYGTQYIKAANGPWELWKIDTTKVTDKERRDYGVETLAEQREKARLMNKKSPEEFLKTSKTTTALLEAIRKEWAKGSKSEYNLTEREINSIGYSLKGQKRMQEALAVFKLNTEFYPGGYNTWDSLGECLLETGKEKEGLAAYKKSLELNPKNTNAQKILAERIKK
jgi:tetratricopeptide (TPR) repeat protein